MKTQITAREWTACKWPYNDAPEYRAWKCYRRRFGRGCVILYPSQFTAGEWSYVASFGADSYKSHSGAFPDGFTLDMVKDRIQQMHESGKF